jgi:hypothetical protein
MKKTIHLKTELQRREALTIMNRIPVDGTYSVTFAEASKRSIEQNSLLWGLLSDVSRQVDWYGQKLTPENWKDIFSASLRKSKVVPGVDGNFVVLGQRTSKMTKKEFSDLLELIQAFGAEHGVKFETNRGE